MKKCIAYILFVNLFYLLPNIADANGSISESPPLKNGNLIASQNLVLESEQVDFTLLDKEYQVKVIYKLNSKIDKFSGKLYFPVLCKKLEYVTIDVPCVSDFKISINDKPQKVEKVKAGVLKAFDKTYRTKAYDQKNLVKNIGNNYIEELNDVEKGAQTYLYSADINSTSKDFLISISYRLPYYYTFSGTTKSSINDYSNDIVYYDFFPASTWMKDKVKTITLNIDATQTLGKVIVPDNWRLSGSARKYEAKLENILIRDVPPFILGIDRKNFKQYTDHRNTLKDLKIKYILESSDTLGNSDNLYDPQKAMDGNPKTAWCSNKNMPEIIITIFPSLSPSKEYKCAFEGIGLINGYAKSKSVWKANRKVKSGILEIEGAVKGNFNFVDTDFNDFFDPYDAINFINIHDVDSYTVTERQKENWGKTNEDKIKLRLKILETYPGDKYNDICISEVYPMFNCY